MSFPRKIDTKSPDQSHTLALGLAIYDMSIVVRKPAFCICENKDADQLCSSWAADQRLCFRYIDSTIPPLSYSEISSLKPSSVVLQPRLCWTWSETLKAVSLAMRLIKKQGVALSRQQKEGVDELAH